jgi:Zn-dependent M16 (insulinase) family peptidase
VAVKISAEEILDVLHEFERKTLLNQEEKKLLKLDERPFQRPIMELSENVEQVVYFPTDQEQNSNGIVSIGWRGPSISQVRELVALDLLLAYLTESSISPIYEHFIETESYCNKLSYQVQEYRETYLTISFTNTQLDKLEKIKPELFQILSDLKSGKQSFDLNRMRSMIKMKIHELKDKFEDSPHDTISRICIGDFLYGNSDDPVDVKNNENDNIWDTIY